MAKQTLEALPPPFRYYISIRYFTDIDATEQSILLMLNSRIGNGEYCPLYEATLAADAKVSISTLRRKLHDLARKCLLSYKRSKGEVRYRFSISRDPIFEAAKAANSRPVKMTDPAGQNDRSRPVKMTACPGQNDRLKETKEKVKGTKTETEKEEAFRPSVSDAVSVFEGKPSAEDIMNPNNDPVSLAMAVCKVHTLRDRNAFGNLLREKGESLFRNVLDKFAGEIRQGECANVENLAALFTTRVKGKKDGPRPSRPPANRTETDNPTPTDLKAQTASLAKSLFKHPEQANGSQAEAKGFIAELLSYAEKNGITDADPEGRYAPVLSQLFKLGCGEALNKLPPRAKNAFACRFLDEEKGRKDLLAKLDECNQKSTPQCADADIDGEIPF